MKIADLLYEMPMPTDWDKDQFNNRTSFAKQLKYAMERAPKLGAGSSRVAFKIPFEGRETVLKIAKNQKGLIQNEHESGFAHDGLIQQLEIMIPFIDYDEENEPPRWIHTELAQPARQQDFIKACGGTLGDLMAAAGRILGQKDYAHYGNADKVDEDDKLCSALFHLVGDYDLPFHEFSTIKNWGIYNGKPLIIDLGVSHDILSHHYSGRR